MNQHGEEQSRPMSTAYINSKKIYFTLWRKARVPIGARKIGDWIPISRAHAITPERVKMVRRVCGDKQRSK